MPDTVPVRVRERKLPDVVMDDKGRWKIQGGRWSQKRIAEYLLAHPIWQSMDDLARVVYGTTSVTLRENVRKHIPKQRTYQLHILEQPIITKYGPRGLIMSIKTFDRTVADDQELLRLELVRARDRKEMTEQRFQALEQLFLLPSSAAC